MMRIVVPVLIVLLLLVSAYHKNPEQSAEALTREYMVNRIGAPAVNRSHIQTRFSPNRWVVIFHHANASCGEHSLWREACRFGSDAVYKHIYTYVERDLNIGPIGARGDQVALWTADLCQTQTLEPPAIPHPTATSKST